MTKITDILCGDNGLRMIIALSDTAAEALAQPTTWDVGSQSWVKDGSWYKLSPSKTWELQTGFTVVAAAPSTLIPGVKYYILSAASASLTFGFPSTGTIGTYCYVQFISGSTATTLTMDLTYAVNWTYTPTVNSLCTIIAEWNGVKWVPVSMETPISVTIGIQPSYTTGATEITVGATATMSGLSYQWQDSADNITFVNIAGKTADSLAVADMTASKYYRCVVGAIGAVTVISNSTQYTG